MREERMFVIRPGRKHPDVLETAVRVYSHYGGMNIVKPDGSLGPWVPRRYAFDTRADAEDALLKYLREASETATWRAKNAADRLAYWEERYTPTSGAR